MCILIDWCQYYYCVHGSVWCVFCVFTSCCSVFVPVNNFYSITTYQHKLITKILFWKRVASENSWRNRSRKIQTKNRSYKKFSRLVQNLFTHFKPRTFHRTYSFLFLAFGICSFWSSFSNSTHLRAFSEFYIFFSFKCLCNFFFHIN